MLLPKGGRRCTRRGVTKDRCPLPAVHDLLLTQAALINHFASSLRLQPQSMSWLGRNNSPEYIRLCSGITTAPACRSPTGVQQEFGSALPPAPQGRRSFKHLLPGTTGLPMVEGVKCISLPLHSCQGKKG